jgi:hypothetical protein
MAKKNFSGTGLVNTISEKPAHKRTLLDEVNTGNSSIGFENSKLEVEELALKRHTFLIDNSVLEKIKDYVYTVRIGGNLMFTQQKCLETALSEFLEGKVIVPRPEEYKNKYKKQ